MKLYASVNCAYRLVWKRAWVAIARNANKHGESMSTRKLVAAALMLATPLALAAPAGGQVSAGSGAINQTGATTTIIQQSQNLAINWQSFGIAANETVRFNQPNASSIALNRVLGQDPSQIFGNLSANGQVFILNPNGVLFGAAAQVNVGGLAASTLSLNDADFLAGKYSFSKIGVVGSVVNQGELTAANGGYIALLAPEVRNEGVITATFGTALLAAGDKVTLNLNNGSLLTYSVDKGSLNALAENRQLIQTDGGQVIMSAKAADALSTAVVNNTGIIEARTIQNHGGVIKLLGDMQSGLANVGGTLDASAPNGGDGGFIETSAAHVKVADAARVTTVAPAGSNGTWLIDPNDYTIAASGGDITGATLSTNLGTGNVSILSSSGAGGSAGAVNVNDAVTWSANKLTLNAQNNININANLNGSGTASLALEYGQGALASGNTSDYIIHAAVNLPAGSNFSTKLGSDGTTKNYTVITSLGAAGSTTTTDLQGMNGNPALNYALGANIGATATSGWNSGSGFAPISLGGTFDGLGHIISNLTINRPAANNVGLFGTTLSGSTVRDVGLEGGSVTGLNYVGGLAGSNYGSISNSYAACSVTGGLNGRVGGLVGQNNKTISTSYASGTVTTGTNGYAGGLVGYNNFGGPISSTTYTDISNSYATGSVTSSVNGFAGGLVGINNSNIHYSYASGSVSGAGTNRGLVGFNVPGSWYSFWDKDTSGQTTSSSSYDMGKTTVQMMTQTTFTSQGWDFTNIWWMSDTSTRPFLRMEYSTTINNAHQLQLMAMNLSANYTLGANINASGTALAAGMGGSAGFAPIGSNGTPFTGNFDGMNYTISGLTISRPSTNYVGLFGYVDASTLSNVSVAGNVTGYDYVGGLVGKTNNSSTISNVTSSATVTGNANVGSIVGLNDPSTLSNVSASGIVTGVTNVGGIVGWNDSSAINGATFSGTVTGLAGSDSVGGLIGKNSGASNISNVFAGGTVSGSANTGGVIGSNSSATVSGLWNTESSGPVNAIGGGSVTNVAGLTGLTLAQTYQQAFYPGWDFVNTWRIYEGHTAPLLKSLLKPLTITADNVSKAYDGTSVGLTGVVYSDPTAAGSSNLFGVGTPYGAVTKNNIGVYAADIWSNQQGYDITIVGGTLTVTKAALSIGGITAANKIYDGTTAATLAGTATFTTLVTDAVTLTGTGIGVFSNKNVGIGKAVTVSGFNLSGADAGNYTLLQPTGLTADIAAKTLSLAGVPVAASRVYNGTLTTTVSGATLSGVVAGDAVTLGGLFADKNAGTGKAVTLALSGTSAGNYSIVQPGGITADITARALTIAAAGVSKVYDAGTNATVTLTSSGKLAADILTAAYTSASYLDKNAGTAKTINVSGITLSGADAANYTYNTTATTTANITKRNLAVTGVTANSKVYDGTTAAALSGATITPLGTDVVTLGGGSGVFNNKNVGTGKAVTVSGYTITGGADAGNYNLLQPTGLTGSITKLALTLSGAPVAASKVYDGTRTASIGGATLTNVALGDTVILGGLFADKNVGTNKAVTLALSGADSINYSIAQPGGIVADITAKVLSLAGVPVAASRVYNGTLTTTVSGATLSGVVAGDAVTLGGLFADKNAGTGKAVTLALSGTSAGNYSIVQPGGITADITARALTIAAAGVSKVYDAGTNATVTLTSSGKLAADILTAAYTSASYLDKNAGTAKTINVSGITLSGADAANYTYNTTATTTANITKRNLAVTGVTANSKVYDGTTAAALSGATITPLGTDVVTLGGGSGVFNNKNVGTGKAVTVSGYTITGGADAGNYNLLQPTGLTGSITKLALTLSGAPVAASKVYDGTRTASIGGATLTNVALGDTVILGGLFADKNVGTNKAVTLALSGTGAGNYSITQPGGLTANITARALTVTAANKTKLFGTANPALTYTVGGLGLVAGDTLATVFTGVLTTTAGVSSPVGSYAITQGTLAANSNYLISTFINGVLTIQ